MLYEISSKVYQNINSFHDHPLRITVLKHCDSKTFNASIPLYGICHYSEVLAQYRKEMTGYYYKSQVVHLLSGNVSYLLLRVSSNTRVALQILYEFFFVTRL